MYNNAKESYHRHDNILYAAMNSEAAGPKEIASAAAVADRRGLLCIHIHKIYISTFIHFRSVNNVTISNNTFVLFVGARINWKKLNPTLEKLSKLVRIFLI